MTEMRLDYGENVALFSKLWTFLICRFNSSHRIVEVGSDLWRLFNLKPMLKAGSAKAGCPGSCLDGV